MNPPDFQHFSFITVYIADLCTHLLGKEGEGVDVCFVQVRDSEVGLLKLFMTVHVPLLIQKKLHFSLGIG